MKTDSVYIYKILAEEWMNFGSKMVVVVVMMNDDDDGANLGAYSWEL